MELNAHIGLRVEEAEGRLNGRWAMADLAAILTPHERASRSVRIYNDCCFTSFPVLEETVVPHLIRNIQKEILECVVKTSQMVTSQSQSSLPLVNLAHVHSSLNCITGKYIGNSQVMLPSNLVLLPWIQLKTDEPLSEGVYEIH